ncbi:MAG: hypothetical protein DWQ10_05850 [Calditrichaeota bacterium]|nr:MAG: hypothetical protein DWQ10_05850 [Calditrichota bacterium]
MKRKIFLQVCITGLFFLAVSLQAQYKPKNSGFGVRASFWNMNKSDAGIRITSSATHDEVNVSGGGGWLYFFSRVDDYWFVEFNIGGIGEVNASDRYYHYDDKVDVAAITPFLLGFRQDLMHPRSYSALRPYLTFGVGAYWISDIHVGEYDYYRDEVLVNTVFEPGGYAGGGFNFHLTPNLALNLDAKYHFIDYNVKHDYSGFDFGMGISFMWGRYRSSRY